MYPVVVGHEIVGNAVRVGSQVSHINVGDRVGLGAQSDSCFNRGGPCSDCSSGRENMCTKKGRCDTYNGVYFSGGKSYGGFANYNRAPGRFVVKIPDTLPSADAAPMLCAGITTYSPLKDHSCGPGKRVGIIGVGGLGHFGILWAKALGADRVVAISRKDDKRADALKLGADYYIGTEHDKDWANKHAATLDLILCTVSSPSMPLRDYLGLLDTKGTFVQLGAPDDALPQIMAFDLLQKGKILTGSCIGPVKQIEEMLQFAAERSVKPWIEERPMKQANRATVDLVDGHVRYRYTLFNDE